MNQSPRSLEQLLSLKAMKNSYSKKKVYVTRPVFESMQSDIQQSPNKRAMLEDVRIELISTSTASLQELEQLHLPADRNFLVDGGCLFFNKLMEQSENSGSPIPIEVLVFTERVSKRSVDSN